MKKVEEVTFFSINSKKRKLTERHLIAGKKLKILSLIFLLHQSYTSRLLENSQGLIPRMMMKWKGVSLGV